jgi:Ca2+-binding EF-hand superfamily protein
MFLKRILIVGLSLSLWTATDVGRAQKKSPANKPDNKKAAPKIAAKPDEKPPAPEAGDFTPAELAKLMDTDKNGQITDQEAKATYDGLIKQGNVKPATEKSQRILKALDKNNNSRVDPDEAQHFVAEARLQTAGGQFIRETFAQLDADNDGAITKREFAEFGRAMKNDKKQAQKLARMFNSFDANRDGKITLHETALAASNLGGRATDGRTTSDNTVSPLDQARKDFDALDRDGDGLLSPQEANPNRQLKAHFKQIDVDLDGSLTLKEVLDFVQSQRPKR